MSETMKKLVNWVKPSKKYAYFFNDGSAEERELLGKKGSNLCEMYRLGLPIPYGCILSTEGCTDFYKNDVSELPKDIVYELERGVRGLEKQTGKVFGSGKKGATKHEALPLIISVRSDAPQFLPGLMSSVLNLGMNEDVVLAMAEESKNLRFAYDTYRRFLQMFGTVVLGLDRQLYNDILLDARQRSGVIYDHMLTESDLLSVVAAFKKLADVPEDPWEQLKMTVRAAYLSWHSPQAINYRDIHNISDDMGISIIMQMMVFGNMNSRSGSGIAHTRNPITGAKEFCGDYLPNSIGEDIASTNRTPQKLFNLYNDLPAAYDKLYNSNEILEKHYRDMQDIEFTIENGNLFILETMNGRRSAHAAVKIAIGMVSENLLTEREAIMRLNAEQMEYFLYPTVDPHYVDIHGKELVQCIIAKGDTISPGVARGQLVFTLDDALQSRSRGIDTILCTDKLQLSIGDNWKNLHGVILLREGLNEIVSEGAKTHLVPTVGKVHDLIYDESQEQLKSRDGSTRINKGDIITIDGSTGLIYRGEVPTISSSQSEDFQTILRWAGKYKRMQVLANADTVEEVQKALELGAEGVGLCRTEHMFSVEDRLVPFRHMILTDDESERRMILEKLLPHHMDEFIRIFRLLDNREITIRLLDHPLGEFLPNLKSPDLSEQLEKLSAVMGVKQEMIHEKIQSFEENNTLLGWRGARLSIVCPHITELQIKAIAGALLQVKREDVHPYVKVIIPFAFSNHEVDLISHNIDKWLVSIRKDAGLEPEALDIKVGASIEVPRACLRASQMAKASKISFLTIFTNELTQTVFGMSKEDSRQFLPQYLQNDIIPYDPFKSLDIQGVGNLMKLVGKGANRANNRIVVGAAGDHANNTKSIKFLEDEDFDFVSCKAMSIPTAKLAAAQAHIEHVSRRVPSFHPFLM